jgi:hypothetical protein
MTIDETTSATQHLPRGVHLVGSVPLGDTEDVFRAATSFCVSVCGVFPMVRFTRFYGDSKHTN